MEFSSNDVFPSLSQTPPKLYIQKFPHLKIFYLPQCKHKEEINPFTARECIRYSSLISAAICSRV